jgi:hypothetical protein
VVPYHAQANGQVERIMKELGEIIRAMLRGRTTVWDSILPDVEDAINTSVNRSIGMSPFEAMFGFPKRGKLAVFSGANPQLASGGNLDQHQALIHAMRALVKTRSDRATAINAAYFNAAHDRVTFDIGSYVLVYFPTPASKLEPHYQGPYRVLSKRDDNHYRVKDIDSLREFDAHVSRLVPFDMSRTTERDEILAHRTADHWVVESVLEHKFDDSGNLFLLIKWADFEGDPTWEPAANKDFKTLTVVQDYISSHDLSTSKSKHAGPSGTATATSGGRSRRA